MMDKGHHNRLMLLLGSALLTLLVFSAVFAAGENVPRARAAEASGLAPQSLQRASETVDVDVISNSFDPDPITITVGDTVRWTRVEGSHNVTADDNSFTSGPVGSSWPPFEQTFDTPGTYQYHCDAHFLFGMAGTITVVAGPDPTPTADVFVPVLLR
jgi:plastocyanin